MAEPQIWRAAPYAPDLPAYSGAGSANINNVYPRTGVPGGGGTPLSYGAIGAPAPLYGALDAPCIGAASFRDSQDRTLLFAGADGDLWRIHGTDSTWANVSSSPGAYSTGAPHFWHFVYFNGDVIGTDYSSSPQIYTLIGSSNFADLVGAPNGKFIIVVKNAFVMLGNTYDPTNGSQPQRLWWSAAGDARSWPTLGSEAAAQVQSGAIDLLGSEGVIMGLATGLLSADAAVFQEYGVKRISYSGPPTVFSISPVLNGIGCMASNSIVSANGIVYYWGQNGIYAFDGSNSVAIGANRVDKTVYNDLDLGLRAQIVGAVDPLNKLIWWSYPSKQNVGICDKLLCYNWQLDCWAIANVTSEFLASMISVGYTLTQLETIFGFTLATIPAPLDSPLWQGGFPMLGLFDASHTLNFLTGPNLAATVESIESQPSGGRRTMIRAARPIIDLDNTIATPAIPSVAIGHRERQVDGVVYGPTTAMTSFGVCPTRQSGRYLRAQLTIPSAALWTNITGVEVEGVPMGRR